MSNWRSPDLRRWRTWRSPDADGERARGGAASPWQLLGWRLFQLLAAAALALAAWRLFGSTPYRIDIDVYRMGGQAWLDGRALYSDGAMFHTLSGLDLPFTYPPLAAIVFSPFAWLPLQVASVAMTLITLVLLMVSTVIVLTRLDVWPTSAATAEPALLRRCWLAAAFVAAAVIHLEPIQANFAFGQINVVMMTLVIADCVPRRTPWPRGVLLGLAIALKLTPAVFLLYFLLRRDGRAMLMAAISFVLATLLGFALAWRDSWEYWTSTVRNTDRIGSAALNTNQNIAGAVARLDLGDGMRFAVWALCCCAVLAVTVWAGRRMLRAGEPVLALICIALFGLVVSPVSWSHHWVWMPPAVLVTAVVAVRRRNAALTVLSAAGVTLMVWSPILLLPKHREPAASWWRQLAGASYVWWALAIIVVAGATVAARVSQRRRAPADTASVPAVG